MKYVKKILGISFFSLLPLSAEAESYCNLLWANNTLPRASVNVSFDGNTSGIFPLNLQAGGLSTVIQRAAKNMDTFVTLDGTYRYWIQYPEAWQTTPDGLKYRITSELEVSGTQTAGVKTVVTSVGYHTWVNTYGCRDVGGTYDFGVASVSGVNIEIDRGTAWPGVYSIQLPVKVAYEENKGNYDGKNGGGWREFPVSMKSFSPVDSKGISITISSKCNVGEQSLSVNMGDNITPDEAKSGVEKKVNFSLTCNAPAKVSLSLKGTDIVDGVNNKTKCGSGSCSLNFDNDSSSKILEVNQGTYQVPITVRFQDANPVAGGFDGSAVLSVDIL
ncbi:nuclease PIN [Escherichia coli]|uniref:nuclease PIN n=1 Tax=Escherichia coli TaxID=562 RepID=UPI00092A280D|nr:nuclease PIN [Escherichia coli]OJS37850.1 nuclease PIN [Escherichia coli]